MDKSMVVKVYDFASGLQQFDNVSIVRLKSTDHNLLIMPDFIPTIGELNGSLSIAGDEIMKEWNEIKGYYVIRNNIFELILKDEYKF